MGRRSLTDTFIVRMSVGCDAIRRHPYLEVLVLGYRSLFDVEAPSVVNAVCSQLYAWLRAKRYDADALADNGDVAQIGSAAEAVITSERLQDGARSMLFTLRESGDPNGAWISQVIAHEPARSRNPPWIWIDVEQEGADRRIAKTPRLARDLLDVLDARDGGASLAATPTQVGVDDVDDLVRALESTARRGPVFVAGTSEDLPLSRWTEYVGRLLNDTVGMAAGYVLDSDATAALREQVGERHAVAPGSLRTYLPGVDPESDLDALRHRFLTTETILRTPRGRIEHTLGQRARDIAIAAPVPRFAARVESRLLAETDARVLGWKPTALLEPTSGRKPHVPVRTAAVSTPNKPPTPEPSTTDLAPEPHQGARMSSETAIPRALEERARELFDAPLDEDLLVGLASIQSNLAQSLAENEVLHASVDQAVQRATAFNTRVLTLETSLVEARRESDDAYLEWAQATDDLARTQREVRELHKRLAAAAVDDAWAPIPAATGREIQPDSFANLLVRLDEFDRVRFFALDHDRTLALDERLPLHASKAWLALLALEDYARGKAEEAVSVGVDQYLQNTPDGYAGYSSNRHARDESEDVKRNTKYRGARMFKVPTSVDPSGTVFMGAHFKIAQWGMISPRLHYYDATAIDGFVYVGHIGEHLPTGQTN